MTARHQIRIGSRRLGRDRSVIDASPAPTVGEMLQAARERKGVDLFRAERDTKIRLRFLAALEDDDYAELPSPVYTKGFIRNYALYLGLEPEEVIARWREEEAAQRRQERVVVVPPPQPIAAPRRGVAITPGMIVALMLGLAVVGFLGYIGWQVTRFVERPVVALSYPANHVMEIQAETLTFEGTAGLSSRVIIQAADGQIYPTTADSSDGSWSRSVPLSKGRNDFRIVARDPITERDSEPVNVIITVPLPDVTSPPGGPSPSPRAITLSLVSPANASTSADGAVEVRGTTSGTRITIASEFLGPVAGAPIPTPTAEPTTPVDGSPAPSPQPSPALDITVPLGGSFTQQLQLAPGRWRITVSAFATGLETRTESRLVTVTSATGSPPIGEGAMTLVIEARGGSSWMRIVADGEPVRPRLWSGPTLRNGSSVTINANREIFIRAGNAGMLYLTLNGRELGTLGNRGQVGNWIIEPGSEPRQTTETR